MTDQPLPAYPLTVTSHADGSLTVSGPDSATITVQPCQEYWLFQIILEPLKPYLYAASLSEAHAFLADRDGTLIIHQVPTRLRWLLPSEPRVGFADFADVLRYAAPIR